MSLTSRLDQRRLLTAPSCQGSLFFIKPVYYKTGCRQLRRVGSKTGGDTCRGNTWAPLRLPESSGSPPGPRTEPQWEDGGGQGAAVVPHPAVGHSGSPMELAVVRTVWRVGEGQPGNSSMWGGTQESHQGQRFPCGTGPGGLAHAPPLPAFCIPPIPPPAGDFPGGTGQSPPAGLSGETRLLQCQGRGGGDAQPQPGCPPHRPRNPI